MGKDEKAQVMAAAINAAFSRIGSMEVGNLTIDEMFADMIMDECAKRGLDYDHGGCAAESCELYQFVSDVEPEDIAEWYADIE